LVIFQPLFSKLDIKERLRGCFSHRKVSAIFGPHLIVLCLVVHLLIGYRKLRDMDYYREDPIVKRLVGLNRMPDVATVSRVLAGMDEASDDSGDGDPSASADWAAPGDVGFRWVGDIDEREEDRRDGGGV
jgi:hypothetical protein